MYNVAIYMYKNQNSHVFTCKHIINTRNRNLTIDIHTINRLSICQHTISYASPQIWNALPVHSSISVWNSMCSMFQETPKSLF